MKNIKIHFNENLHSQCLRTRITLQRDTSHFIHYIRLPSDKPIVTRSKVLFDARYSIPDNYRDTRVSSSKARPRTRNRITV